MDQIQAKTLEVKINRIYRIINAVPFYALIISTIYIIFYSINYGYIVQEYGSTDKFNLINLAHSATDWSIFLMFLISLVFFIIELILKSLKELKESTGI